MTIGMTTQNQNMETKQKYATRIRTLIVQVKFEDVYADLGEDIEKRFDTSIYEIARQLPIGNYH